MSVAIGAPIGTQIPFQIQYVAEVRADNAWKAFPQEPQKSLFDTATKTSRNWGTLDKVLFDGGVLKVKNGKVVQTEKTFGIPEVGTFRLTSTSEDKGDHWDIKVKLTPLQIEDPEVPFLVDGGGIVKVGSEDAKKRGLNITLTHKKAAD